MPFKSRSQAKLMFAAAESSAVAKRTGVKQSVAKKFVKEGQKSLKKLPAKVRGKM